MRQRSVQPRRPGLPPRRLMRIEAAFPDLRQPMEVEDTGREEERKEKSHRAAVAGHVSGHDRGGDGDVCAGSDDEAPMEPSRVAQEATAPKMVI